MVDILTNVIASNKAEHIALASAEYRAGWEACRRFLAIAIGGALAHDGTVDRERFIADCEVGS